jgi:hypothetical protein
MAELTRTLILSPPETYALVDDVNRMREWAGVLTDAGGPVAIVEVARTRDKLLAWEPAVGKVRAARIEATLESKGFGTRLTIRTEFRAAGLLPGRRRDAETLAERRMASLLDQAMAAMGVPQRRPFSAV